MKVVIGASSFSTIGAVELLTQHGFEVVLNPYGRKMTEQETVSQLQGATGLLAGLEVINENVLAQVPGLKAVARIGIGMDSIDIPAVETRGIKLSNTPDAPTNAVAEMVLAALLAIGRRIIESNQNMHTGVWKKAMGFSLDGLNVLLIGYGRIGRRVAEMLRFFNANVMVYDPAFPEQSVTDLNVALASADVISLHVSGNKEVLTPAMFSHMQKGVVILNSARGSLINEDLLFDKLNTGDISYFWGDVFWDEPYTGKLTGCANAILTPHTSTYTKQCRQSMEMQAAQNLLRDLQHV